MQSLGKMSPKALAAYLVDVQAKQEKLAKKKWRFGTDNVNYKVVFQVQLLQMEFLMAYGIFIILMQKHVAITILEQFGATNH